MSPMVTLIKGGFLAKGWSKFYYHQRCTMYIRFEVQYSKKCDKGYRVIFEPHSCLICEANSKNILLIGKRIKKCIHVEHKKYCI